jgi:ribosomal protein S18 acetylase RimI-like enzyme
MSAGFKPVAHVEARRALSAQPHQQQMKPQWRHTHSHRKHGIVAATTEGTATALPFKQLLSWAGNWAPKRERIVYSSVVPSGSDLHDIAVIWAREFNRPQLLESTAGDDSSVCTSGIALIEKALKNSFRVTTAYAEMTEFKNGEMVCTSRKLIGCARCVSDGYFAAQVVDCCVDLQYQRRGIGTKLIRTLCKETRAAGAQSIAVFSAPDSRLFFWKAGFRMDFRCRILHSCSSVLVPQHVLL